VSPHERLERLKDAVRNEGARRPPPEPGPDDLARAAASLTRARARDPEHPLLAGMDPATWWTLAWRSAPDALTMVPRAGLDNVQFCVEAALADGVPGDLCEVGCWRGGVGVLLRGLLAAHDEPARRVWLADGFQGLPEPDAKDDAVAHELLSLVDHLRADAAGVRAAFERHGLLDDRVRLLEGWFEDTLPAAPIERLAVLRLDADYHASTRVALDALYPRVAPGGFVIVDDYGLPVGARRAVDEYRAAHGVEDELVMVTDAIACWRRRGREDMPSGSAWT
jgi:O-methyltransferase